MIILGKNKDYYDYLVGIYGIDKDIVFDRKDAISLLDGKIILSRKGFKYHLLRELFNKECEAETKHKEKIRTFYKSKYVDYSQPIGDIYFFILEIGYKQYTFQVERYIDENDEICIDHKLLSTTQVSEKICNSVTGIAICEESYFGEKYLRITNKSDSNLILKDTWLTKYISAEEAYNEIYNYLISCKDKEINDSRTDVQKAESHGFNKESFRNPIRTKDLK